jgi:hypothetical protein
VFSVMATLLLLLLLLLMAKFRPAYTYSLKGTSKLRSYRLSDTKVSGLVDEQSQP